MIFLMPIYFIFAVIVIYKLMKKYRGQHKWRRCILLAFLFYLPVGWDVILGRAYFQYLCNKDGGVHIYQTVELGPEHWYPDGSPKFYTKKGDFDEGYFNNKYRLVTVRRDQEFETSLPILRELTQIIDLTSETVLGEVVTYLYTNGWVINTWQPFSTSGMRCPRFSDYPKPSDFDDNPMTKKSDPWGYRKFDSYIFLKTDNKEVEK
ncbi:MAG: hypothetical protein P1P93_05750 [Gammaproteobacteria bacterium]|nr:hypothetical protein [Gammaproteobacteria bacterium]